MYNYEIFGTSTKPKDVGWCRRDGFFFQSVAGFVLGEKGDDMTLVLEG